MKRFRQKVAWLVLIFCALIAISCNRMHLEEDEIENKSTTILFVGNSLTYTNDLPNLLAKVGEQKGRNLKTKMLAFPNYALEDHWNEGKLQELLQKGDIDFLVVQQGPSSQEDGRVSLLDYGNRIKKMCDLHQTKMAFFMVWPSVQNWATFGGVIQNYSNAASENDAILCPVGTEWKLYIEATKDYGYYGPDRFHPSLQGSKMAAKIIYESLFE